MPKARGRQNKKINGPTVQTLFSKFACALVFLAFYLLFAIALSAIVYLAYQAGMIGYANFTYLSQAITLLSLSIAVFFYLTLYKRQSIRSVPLSLGFISKKFLRNIFLGLIIFLMIILLELIVALIGSLVNVQINTNVASAFIGAPFWYYLFAALIEPINEEIMFRAFLVPRIGIVPSALIFGILHYSYDSTFGIEVIAATILGLLAGYTFKKTKSIYPGMLAHIMINTIGVLSVMG